MPKRDTAPLTLQWFESLHAQELDEIADGLILQAIGAVEKSVEFILADTKGVGHGRRRAKMCRRLKHCEISPQQSQQLVSCILNRLTTGCFSEQFDDQLRLALHLDRKRTCEVARNSLRPPSKDHIRRFAMWILLREKQHCLHPPGKSEPDANAALTKPPKPH